MPSASSDSYRRIYAVVRRIPRGKVATYGQVADLAGMHGAARLVGYALHALKDEQAVPWHRVLAAGGRITLAKLDGSAATTQRIRLEHEGVRFTGRGTVEMAEFQWEPGKPRTARTKAARRPVRGR